MATRSVNYATRGGYFGSPPRVVEAEGERFLTPLTDDYQAEQAVLADGAYAPAVDAAILPQVTLTQAETWS